MALWQSSSGNLLFSSSGNLYDCSSCPCGPGSTLISTTCCSSAIPSNLTISFQEDNNCAGVSTESYAFDYSTVSGKWETSSRVTTANSEDYKWLMYCSTSVGWIMDFEPSSSGCLALSAPGISPSTVACDPFDATFIVPGGGCCDFEGGPAFQAIVTE